MTRIGTSLREMVTGWTRPHKEVTLNSEVP